MNASTRPGINSVTQFSDRTILVGQVVIAMSDQWRIEIDHSRCVGSSICTGTAPHAFSLGENSRARPASEVADADDEIAGAAYCCPAEAIRLFDAATGELLDLKGARNDVGRAPERDCRHGPYDHGSPYAS